jgi:hypothetical protein
MVLYQIYVFGAGLKSNMAARAHNVFWLVEILKIFLLETTKNFSQWEHIMDPGSHVGFQISTKNINLVEDHPVNISGKFGWFLFGGFREEDLKIVTLQEWSLGGPVLNLWIVCQSEIQDGRHDST